ncbi:MAG TPA: T9SS type A sorting domain-containing protein [bacterium]|nr:T9SS type A sorting domain-containing protein [bacterium]
MRKTNIQFRNILPGLFILFSAGVFSQTDRIQTDVPAIKDVYGGDFTFGCLLSYPHIGLPGDPYVPGQSAVVAPNGGYLIRFHMNSMSPGNNMKPQNTVDIGASAAAFQAASPEDRDSVDVRPVVRFNGNLIAQLNWARRQGFTFRGHTLVWHNQTPGTAFFRTGYSATGTRLTRERMIERMDHYIGEVIRLLHENWPGMLSAMDVVNEAVNENGLDRTQESEWYLTFGDNGYIMKAFELTRKWTAAYGETQMKLYYNDYNTHNPAKANGIVRICAPIYEAGFLDGIGMQDHDGLNTPTAAQWIASYNKFDPICTEMAVTELDVTTGSADPSASVLASQANQYAQLFKCFVERSYFSGRGKIINVSKDGLNDQFTFKTNQSSSLWDARNQCKPAFYAVVDVGIRYNRLDSLLSHAAALQEDDYTGESWSVFADARISARNAMDRNYSSSVSAPDALGEAIETLTAAIEGLEETSTAAGIANVLHPKSIRLGQNYPNPFNPVTQIRYTVAEPGFLSLKVYNLLGEEVAILFEGKRHPGEYTAFFDGRGLESGVYVYRLESDRYSAIRKMTLLK